MTVRMITLAAGPQVILRPGKSYNLPGPFARELIEARAAEPSKDPKASRPGKPDPQEVDAMLYEDGDE